MQMDQGTRFPVAMSSGSGAESARGLALPGWYRIATGALLIAIWSAVLAGAPALLPVQMASWLAFLALIVTPGYLLGDLLISNTRLDWVERLAIAFPLGIAVLGIPGMVSLLGHGTVTQLAIGWTVVSAAVILVWVAFVVWMALVRALSAHHVVLLTVLAVYPLAYFVPYWRRSAKRPVLEFVCETDLLVFAGGMALLAFV